jgi:1-acyl-sn-glycerol-3-phosphate acyltransferase
MVEKRAPRPRKKAPRPSKGSRPAARPPDVEEVQGELASAVPHAGPMEPAPAALPALRGARAWVRRWGLRGVAHDVDAHGLDPIFEKRAASVLELLFARYWRVDIQGLENIPSHGRALLVGNHSGVLPYDALMLMHGVRSRHPAGRLPRALVEDHFWNLPFVGPTLARLGGVRANPDNAEHLLRDEQVVAVFPEGSKGLGKMYADRYRLQRFGRGGFVRLALRTRAPVIPVAVVGAEELHPLLGKIPLPLPVGSLPFLPITPTFPWLGPLGALPLPSQWSIRLGPPIPMGTDPRDADDVERVAELTETVRGAIQQMVDDALAARGGSVWR